MSKEYSIIVPVFNSEQSLPELTERVHKVCSSLGKPFEIIFVDDSSVDASWEILKSIKATYPEAVKCIRLAENYGQHNATVCGFRNSSGKLIITIDDDLQHPPEEIPKLISEMERTNLDVIYGISKNQHPFIRKLGSNILKHYSERFNQGYGNWSSFRLIRSEIIQKISGQTQYSIFIDQLLYWHTAKVSYVKVEHNARKYGRSTYSNRKIALLSSNLILFYTSLPLKFMTYFGVLLSIGSFSLAVFFAIRKIFFNVSVEGFTALIVTLLFTASAMLVCFGIIGEYLSRIYSVMNQRPPFLIREVA